MQAFSSYKILSETALANPRPIYCRKYTKYKKYIYLKSK